MTPVHAQVLAAGCAIADDDWTFAIADLARALPHLNPGTVRTHVASRCCVNAPPHHESRYRYFRSVGRGRYRVEPPFRARVRAAGPPRAWQDRVLASMPPGVDPSLVAASLRMTPTERLETMRRAAESLAGMSRDS